MRASVTTTTALSMLPPPSGYGPWSVFLVTNVHPNPGKKTDIKIHTHWELLLHAMNTAPRAWWIPIMVVGRFTSWDAALRFKDLWESTTRNLRNRIDVGWELYQSWQRRYDLVIQLQPLYKEEYIREKGWSMDALSPRARNGKRPRRTKSRRRKREIAYREIIHDPTKPRISVSSVHDVETKRRCLGAPPKRHQVPTAESH